MLISTQCVIMPLHDHSSFCRDSLSLEMLFVWENKMKAPNRSIGLLSYSDQVAKLSNHIDIGYETGILYLAPARSAGRQTLCASSTEACELNCIFHTGRGRMKPIIEARTKKTLQFLDDRERFMENLNESIRRVAVRARNKGVRPAIRLNGTSDIRWENQFWKGKNLMDHWPDIQFYDYTKHIKRCYASMPANYYLVFSRSEENMEDCMRLLRNTRKKVAVVFPKYEKPKTWMGYRCVDGDAHDLIFLHRGGRIISLSAKGPAKSDNSGFVWREQ